MFLVDSFLFCWGRKTRIRPRNQVKRKAAFSLGGNFVEDLTLPIEENYDVTTNILGSGSSAEVVVGEHRRNKRKYAIKRIDLSQREIAWRYEREKNFLRDIDHTNVVRLFEVYTSPTALHFVMELCTGGHLGQVLRTSRLGRLDESVARDYILQLTRAIAHCHHHGICHRDVKLQNILLESTSKDAQIKLVDFGNGVRYRNVLPLTKIVGTTYTAAPEVFREHYDERCDVWSLGVVTYILLSGKRPFEKSDLLRRDGSKLGNTKDSSIVASILLGRYHFNDDVWDEVHRDAANFIRCCFVADYTQRSSAAAMLEHPWLVFTKPCFNGELFIHHLNKNNSLSTVTAANMNMMNDGEFSTVSTPATTTTLPASSLSHLRISPTSAQALKRALKRELTSPFAGMRHASMLAVAFAMPTTGYKVQALRRVFQEMDQDGNGTIGKCNHITSITYNLLLLLLLLLVCYCNYCRER